MTKRSAAVDIALLVAESENRARLRASLAPLGNVVFADSPTDLLRTVLRNRVRVVVLQPRPANGTTTAAIARDLRDGFPSLPILVYCELKAEHVSQVPELVQAGADGVIIKGFDDVGSALRQLVARSSADRVAVDALDRLNGLIPPPEHPVVAFCLAHAYRPLRVREVAGALGLHRRTLANRALAASLPAPGALISWCRLLHAARLLDDTGRSVEQTARLLGFGSGTALRNMMRRYTAMRPTVLRRGGAFDSVIRLLRKRIVGSLRSARRRDRRR